MADETIDSDPDRDLDWLAFQYIAGDLTAELAARFEERLASEQAAREAVARAVEVAQLSVLAAVERVAANQPAVGVRDNQRGRDNQRRSSNARWSSSLRRSGWVGCGIAAGAAMTLIIASSLPHSTTTATTPNLGTNPNISENRWFADEAETRALALAWMMAQSRMDHDPESEVPESEVPESEVVDSRTGRESQAGADHNSMETVESDEGHRGGVMELGGQGEHVARHVAGARAVELERGIPPNGSLTQSTGLDDTGLDDTGLDDTGLDDTGLDDTGLDDTGLDDTGLDAVELDLVPPSWMLTALASVIRDDDGDAPRPVVE